MPKRSPPLSTGQVAAQLGVPQYAVRRTLDAIAPDAPRIGRNRLVTPGMQKKLADELYLRGHLAKKPQ